MMRILASTIAAVAALSMLGAQPAGSQARDGEMLVIAHRGASAERPEHTLAAYERAIDQGADYIELDLVLTKDGAFVSRHENELSETTDVATRPEFGGRGTTKVIDGEEVTGWFSEDFTLAEIETLRARERLPELRPANTAFDYLQGVPSLGDVIVLVRAKEEETGRRIGLYIELKHPAYFEGLGLDPAQLLLNELGASGYTGADPVFIQSFEITPLVRVKSRSDFKTIQLVEAEGGPADAPANVTYAKMLTPEGLAQVARYADGIGADMRLLIGDDGKPTPVIADAHAAGLLVHAWTLRGENAFLPAVLRRGEDDGARGCVGILWSLLDTIGVDGVFTDGPAYPRSASGDPEGCVAVARVFALPAALSDAP